MTPTPGGRTRGLGQGEINIISPLTPTPGGGPAPGKYYLPLTLAPGGGPAPEADQGENPRQARKRGVRPRLIRARAIESHARVRL